MIDAAGAGLPEVRREVRIALRFTPAWPRMLLPAGTVPQIAIDAGVAPLPDAPAWFRGVLARRGNMVPVFDVAAAFGLEKATIEAAHIVVLDPEGEALATLCCEAPLVVSGAPHSGTPSADLPADVRTYVGQPLHVDGQAMHEFAIRRWLADFAPRLAG